MRVLLPEGEEKGSDPRFSPSTSSTPPSRLSDPLGATVAPPQHSRPPPREASAEVQPCSSNGKRNPAPATRPSLSKPSTENVDLERDVKDDERDVDGKSSTAAAPEGRPAAGSPACDVASASVSTPGTLVGGGGSGSEVLPARRLSTEDEIEKAFEAELRAKGWELRRQEGDGNCLFRAISQQIYGDPGMHGDIRRQCLDFMRKERDHYSQFVSEAFDSYVSRKEKDGVHGNNPEMQAASELFNRPIEVYVPEKGTVPINIFQSEYRSGNAPIRVSYHGGNHYNAVIDPEEASVGQGLGIPGLSKEAAEKESLKRALAESCSSAHHVFPGKPPSFFKGGAGAHDSFGADFGQSDLRATQEELEQAAITASLADYHSTVGGGGGSSNSNSETTAFSIPRRGGRGVGLSSGGRLVGRGAARGSADRGERRVGGAAWAGGAASTVGTGSGAGRMERGGWMGGGGDGGGGSSSSSSRKRRRPGSPPGSARKASPSSADSSTSSAVREMVWSYGFPLARVLHAHDLVGDSVDDMLVLLTSDAFQPPERNDSGATAASFGSE